MTHSRRKAFMAGVASALATPAVATSAEPDAELLRLCSRFDALEQAKERVLEDEHPSDSPAGQAQDAEWDRLSAQQGELLDRIAVLPCLTSAGVYALGRSLTGFLDEGDLEDDFKPGFDHRLLAALLRGIAQGQARPAASALALPAPATVPKPNPDAALIAACAEYVERDKRVLALAKKRGHMHSDNPKWAASTARLQAIEAEHRRQEDEISEMVARTPEGIRAKALATKHQLAGGGCEVTEPMSEENWLAWSLIEDLLRVA